MAGLTNVQKFKEEHDFSDELYRNWIKILGLNQVRKKKQRRQHLEDVRNQREGVKATTEDEEETRDPEKESSTIELRVEKLSGEREGETQPSKVVKSRKNEDKSSNQEKVSNKQPKLTRVGNCHSS